MSKRPHFQRVTGQRLYRKLFVIATLRECAVRLNKYLPNYEKVLDMKKIDLKSMQEAIERAKKRDNSRGNDWPRGFASTTVYRLVENIVNSVSARERI